jgi:hypothetical protein
MDSRVIALRRNLDRARQHVKRCRYEVERFDGPATPTYSSHPKLGQLTSAGPKRRNRRV